jgi:hypothetical protein
MDEVKLHYHIANGGDGSVSLQLHPNAKAAKKADKKMLDNGESWSEPSNGYIRLKVEDGKVFYANRRYKYPKGKPMEIIDDWIELK